VNKSGLYAEFKNKEDLFIASLRRYFETFQYRGTLTIEPLRWSNIESFLKQCNGSWGWWGQKGCFSVNSMREFSDRPTEARKLMIGSVMRIRQQLIRNLSVARQKRRGNEDHALIIAFFTGISLEQNFDPTEKQIAHKIAQFMGLIRAM